ncbi:MAG TPA: PAS domain S-box protein [Bryobacteraceae bacterium]|nr:PAS domain S-box protein [Bryobacteraceae bacterium]
MRSFRDRPIGQKLTIILTITTATALILSGAGILISDSILFGGYIRRDLSALANIIGDNATAALAFNDPHAASDLLNALHSRTHLVSACIYREDGTLLARYARTGARDACPAPAAQPQMLFAGDDIRLSHPIFLSGGRIGTLTLLYDLGEIHDRRVVYGATVLAVLLASSFIALLLSARLRRLIAAPITRLASTAASVSDTKDYSLRAQKFSGDELGVLVDTFNDMLAGIETRDGDLKRALIERSDALRTAQESHERLETTLSSIGDAVISTNVDGHVMFANRLARSILGRGETDLAGRHLDEVFTIRDEFTRERLDSPLLRVLGEGSTVTLADHTVLIAAGGKEIPIDYSSAPIRGDSGNITGAVLVFRDVTARRRADETRRLLGSIVESSDDAIIGLDLNGVVTAWNRGAERMYGYAAEEMIGRPCSILAAPGQEDETTHMLRRIAHGERIEQYQSRRRTKAGLLINVSLTISPVYDALGRIVGASKIARDVTEQMRAAERLAELNDDLRRSNENLARSNEDLERFAFVASHDLQEPLRMIAIYSQLLLKVHRGEFDEQAAMCVDQITAGTQRMRDLLADLLAYAEVGAKTDAPVQTVDLNVVLDKVRQNLRAAIEDTGAVLTSDPLPTICAWEAHFVPLFQNLIGNAIKYRGEKPPRIHVSVREVEGVLQFCVADNGIGIAPDYHQKIFVPFKRLHGKNTPGTGIGLAICQRVVERYGGRIWVDSSPGQGAKFQFTAPDASVIAAAEK